LVRKGYRNLSIPEQPFRELEDFVEKSQGKYVSVAETVREAIREFLEKHKQPRLHEHY
jgi:Arc/MetJ-type ribon-helix-helix transcriptional regulator